MLEVGVITLFPKSFQPLLTEGITGRAASAGLLKLQSWNPRDYSQDPNGRIDDRPFGGGPGMVMQVEPLLAALAQAKQVLPKAKVVYASPQGKPFNQQAAQDFAKAQQLIFVAGRYEGIDERFIEMAVDEEWSIGDYVLTGGELAVNVMLDASIRFIPGALGDEDSAANDSFSVGLLDCPHYTRPAEFQGQKVPEVLLSGDHKAIARWRLMQALGRTWQRRADLLNNVALSQEQQELLKIYQTEHNDLEFNNE